LVRRTKKTEENGDEKEKEKKVMLAGRRERDKKKRRTFSFSKKYVELEQKTSISNIFDMEGKSCCTVILNEC